MSEVRLRYTRRAREDLLDIWRFLAREASTAVADRVFDRIEAACNGLKRNPMLAPARPDIGEGARALVIQRWLALYRIDADGILLVRIIDGARDLADVEWKAE